MKTVKSLFSIMLIAFVLVATSCSKSSDPTPASPTTPTTPVYVGYWKFVSATVTPATGSAYTINSLCLDSRVPAFNVEFKLTSTTDAIQKSPCFSDATLTYVGTVTAGKLTAIDFKDTGVKAYSYTNIVIDEVAKTITADQTLPIGTAKSIKITFQLQ